ncbi:hypothetical protein LOTGIDRAFT_132744 [Lottia gigantea]|uniref:FAM69 protein-kinase domain-containing protein n=1 Tax=Lottia gigantea TaxID=225164 RepID=V3ZN87_LOTGI|nr:hypothetical protein LOTGIDRAFT_132744 [Lottia gigantea]ESO83900.1 hypothetical protein LOTGIDRAFT_132744 [Lottia gigantea]
MLFISLLCSFILYYCIYRVIFSNDLQNESFLETDKCPACFGSSACGMLLDNHIKLTGWSKVRFLDVVNVKNVHFGKHIYSEEDVVLKKLALNNELVKVDNALCKDANRPEGCDIARVIYKTNTAHALKDKPILPKHLNSLEIGMFTCGSYRLLDKLWSKYQEKQPNNVILYRDKVQLMYISMVNTESLLMQTFPASDGWPFPKYYGACGRFVVLENAGKPLTEYYNAPFSTRVDLAYQLMKMAILMSENKEDFILYWTDIQYENFAVDVAGKVKIIDAENIIVVDKMAIEAKQPLGWSEPYESKFDDCEGRNCLTFSTDNLCRHMSSDHNYYALCRNLLSKYGTEPGMSGGLLHDMPKYAEDDWDLLNLLNECAYPSKPNGRFIVKETLLSAFDNLRNVDKVKDVKFGETQNDVKINSKHNSVKKIINSIADETK